MSILWMDDPSFYGTSQINSRYDNSPSGAVVAGGRFGGTCIQQSGIPLGKNVAAIQTGTLAFSVFLTTLPAANKTLLSFLDSASAQCDLRVTPTGTLQATRNGTSIGSASTNALSANTWYRIEFKVKIDPSVGTIEAHVNGSSTGWIPSTGSLNTRNTANSTFNQVQWGESIVTGVVTMNDLFLTDSNSPNADFLGDVRCYLRMPNADSSVTWTNTWAAWAASTVMAVGQQIKDSNGNVQQVQSVTSDAKTGTPSHPSWATTGGLTTVDNHVTWVVVGSGANPSAHNWMAVSEVPVDGDNSYNLSATPTQVDLFTLPSLPAGANGILAVDNVIYVRKDDAGTRTVQGEVSSNGTTANTASLALSTSYQFLDQILQTDPHTSSAWTVPNANALLVGYDEIA